MMKAEEIKKAVKDRYGEIAVTGSSCCATTTCCGNTPEVVAVENITKELGYSETEIQSVPVGSNLGLGCGNPIALSSLQPGEIVLDLGSGAGFDVFLAAQQVGETGKERILEISLWILSITTIRTIVGCGGAKCDTVTTFWDRGACHSCEPLSQCHSVTVHGRPRNDTRSIHRTEDQRFIS